MPKRGSSRKKKCSNGSYGKGVFFWKIRLIAKSSFRNGGDSLPGIEANRQVCPTISETAFGKCSNNRLNRCAARRFPAPDSPATPERVDRLFGVQRARRSNDCP